MMNTHRIFHGTFLLMVCWWLTAIGSASAPLPQTKERAIERLFHQRSAPAKPAPLKRPRRSLPLVTKPVTKLEATPTPVATAQASPSPTVTPPADNHYALRPVEVNVSQWPLLRFDFAIEHSGRVPFTSLAAENIQGTLDGRTFTIAAHDLATARRAGTGLLLVIDLSRSMTLAPGGVSKLAATQRALLALLDQLDAQDRVALLAFDLAQHVVTAPTTDRAVLRAAIQNLQTFGASANGTRLYDAADYALNFAAAHQLHNVILLSDGCEYAPESRRLTPDEFDRWQTTREQRIAEQTRQTGARLFTIAIGDERKGNGLYVDTASLARLTRGTLGGSSSFVNLPALLQQADDDARYAALLAEKLQTVFAQIQQSFRYDYSLTLRDASVAAPDALMHKVALNFAINGARLPFEFSYTWPHAASLPVLGEWKVFAPVLIETPALTTSRRALFGIFGALLACLAALALIPSAIGRGEHLRARWQMRKAIVTVSRNSSFIGGMCPNENQSQRFKAGDTVIVCPVCATPHHLACWSLTKHRCWQRHCDHQLVIPKRFFAEVS